MTPSVTETDKTKYRLGLDLGTNSIGWAAVLLDDKDEPCGLLDMGVRIFPDGRKAGNSTDRPSNAVERRDARGQRRLRDRYLSRRNRLMQALVEYGLMPEDVHERKMVEVSDPYALRARALDEPLERFELGRALLHLNQRRGFKSNRKTDKGNGDSGPVKEGTDNLHKELSASQCRTLGEFLYRRQHARDTVRFRNSNTSGKAQYEFYPTRQMLLDEFEFIRAGQEGNPCLDAKQWDELCQIIFHQRDLRPQAAGKCTLDPATDQDDKEGFRCSWAHPLAQRFRIWEEVRNLEVREAGQKARPLSKKEGNKVAAALFRSKEVSFDRIRRLLSLSDGTRFNLESDRRKKLQGDETAARLSHKSCFDKTWRNLPPDKQIEIVDLLLNDDMDDASLVDWLVEHTSLDREAAERIISISLPEGHCRLGLRAIRNIVPHMKDGMKYHEAAAASGYDHAKLPTGELSLDGLLPYYGERLKDHLAGSGNPEDHVVKRYGRYPNPTVHIGLNQLRGVVNALIKKYNCPPHQVVIEVTRDLKRSKKQREKIDKEQTANQKRNDERNKKLAKIGERQDARNRLKLRLWEELNPVNLLDRCCPFTGERISLSRLFSKDNQVEIEHLIPWSVSYDDSAANKVVALTYANRKKGQLTPYQAFGDTPEWEGIAQRAAKLPPNKQWRFAPDAHEQFREQGGFLARQLNETGWLARLAKEYLMAVVHPDNIWVIPGRLTDLIRGKWGLKSLLPEPPPGEIKNRNDHRHHAIDALVVALTSRSLLQRMSSAYDVTRNRIIASEPWQGITIEEFRSQVQEHLDRMVVSHRPNHGKRGEKGHTTGQLHKAMAYGLGEPVDAKAGRYNVVQRKDLSEFTAKDLDDVPDKALQEALRRLWQETAGKPAEFAKQAAAPGVLPQPVRKIRIYSKQRVIPITHKDSQGRVHKKGYLPGGNEFADVWRLPNGNWQLKVVTSFRANQSDFRDDESRPHPDAKKMMRLQINDMGALGEGPNRLLVRVRSTSFRDRKGRSPRVSVCLDLHNEAQAKEKEYSAKQLKEQDFRKVRVDELGRVYDRGPFKP